jgi:hypothetical protein
MPPVHSIKIFRLRRWDGGTATAGLDRQNSADQNPMEVRKSNWEEEDWEEEEDECEVYEYYVDFDCAE